MALQVELVSPERILFSGDATSVTARTADGDIAFLTGHAPFIGLLNIGVVTIDLTDGTRMKVAVHGGFVEVMDDRVTILSDVAELPDQIDRARAERALAAAQGSTGAGDAEADAAARRARVRLELVGG
ncbi:MAG: F0F1 ATP synthase subunit epsilon [Actinomycetota bacterium]|nr:F0F1 ATP synthase subunit epsilon [Actinomycetota bacterium]